ncbi:MAG: hypothetical protein U0354_11935 [Candidatus Sericytochromatia bacterium]
MSWFFSNKFIKYVYDDFTYNCNIISIDNIYDESRKSFSGQILSSTNFSYEIIERKDNIVTIKNRFDVRKPSGKKIFTVERLYGINSNTGSHVLGFGDKNRSGYLFAPQNLYKQDFIYWHINYDVPAKMHFVNEENIEGLKLYKYQSKYKADQTKNLSYLPKVPEERKKTRLRLNFDKPLTTGRMIKYEDEAIAWYYDIHNKKRLYPWNKFHNEYDPTSISNQIDITKIEI